MQSSPSWDLVITLVFVIGITYGFIMLRDRILAALLSVYAGTLIANYLAGPISKFFNGDTALLNKIWVESSASPFAIKVVLFLAVILLFLTKSGLVGRRSSYSFFELGAYSFFTVCITLASLFSFMEPAKVATYTATSKLATLIVDHHALWYVAPLFVLLFMGRTTRARSSDDY